MKGVLKGVGYFAYYVVVTLIIQFTVSFGFVAIGSNMGITDEQELLQFTNNNFLITTGVSGWLVALFMIVIIKANNPEIKKEMKLVKLKAIDVIKACVLTVPVAFAFYLITYNIEFKSSTQMITSLRHYYDINPALGILLLVLCFVVIAPASEEIALRGIVYTRIEKDTKPIVAIGVSALLFGLMHCISGGMTMVVGTFFMGLVLGFIFYKFKSLMVCIIANMAAKIPDVVFVKHPELTTGIRIAIISLCIVIFAAGILWILKDKNKDNI